MSEILCFIAGMFVGCFLGMLVISLGVMAKKGDNQRKYEDQESSNHSSSCR